MDFGPIVFPLLSAVFAAVSIIIGLGVSGRCSGKLRTSVVTLTFAMAIVFVREFLSLINLNYAGAIENSIRLLVLILIFISVLNMRQMIKVVDSPKKK